MVMFCKSQPARDGRCEFRDGRLALGLSWSGGHCHFHLVRGLSITTLQIEVDAFEIHGQRLEIAFANVIVTV